LSAVTGRKRVSVCERDDLDGENCSTIDPVDDDQAGQGGIGLVIEGTMHPDHADFGIRKVSWRAEAVKKGHDFGHGLQRYRDQWSF